MFISRNSGVILLAAFAASVRCVFAYGPWLEWTPLGGVELDDSGLPRAALERRLDEIERETADKPMIVTRAKSLAMMFDNVRLAVNTNDLFVYWHPDSSLLPLRTIKRVKDFAARSPSLREVVPAMSRTGAFKSKLDTSHTCPDWESILKLGSTGLAERARRRTATAQTDDERIFLDCVAEVYGRPYAIDKDAAANLRTKTEAFRIATKTTKSIQLVMVTSSGLARTMYSGIVNREVSLDDLFA